MWEWQGKEKVEKQWLEAEGRYTRMLAEMGEQAKPETAARKSETQSKLCTVMYIERYASITLVRYDRLIASHPSVKI